MKKSMLARPLLILAAAVLLSGCNHSPDLSAGDDPEQGYMSRLTADQIFTWNEASGKSGVEIIKFRNAAVLKNYLEGGSRQSAAAASLLVINHIDGKPVVRIAARAFSPAVKGGADDITTVVSNVSLPETIESLGACLFTGTARTVTMSIPPAVAERLPPEELKAAAGNTTTIQKVDPGQPGKTPEVIVQGPSGSGGGGGGSSSGGGSTTVNPPPVQYYPPVLLDDPSVRYSPDGLVSAAFTFDMDLPAPAVPGWVFTAEGPVITAAPGEPVPGEPVRLSFTVAHPQDPDKTTTVPEITLMPVTGDFPGLLSGTEYTVAYADGYGAAGLKNKTETLWYYVKDSSWQAVFKAIYIPNAPDSTDTAIMPKAAMPYTEEISRTALNLFKITPDGPNAADCLIEIKGEALPYTNGMGPNHIIVVDIGIPREDNSGLPLFSIPDRGLGRAGERYDYFRLRVNRGARMVILADNSGYIASGPGHPCPPGNAAGSVVEIMDNGKLRVGAYEGYPLGEDSRIIAFLHSSLALGPDRSGPVVIPGHSEARDRQYQGGFIGPGFGAPGIAWGTGDQNGNYLELYRDRIAFAANIAVQKTLELSYSLWFVNGPTLTINANSGSDSGNDSFTINGKKGLFAGDPGLKFYGTASTSGGINIGNPAAGIVLRPGNVLSQSFITLDETDPEALITPGIYEKKIVNRGSSGSSAEEPYDDPSIVSYLNWDIQGD
jgi:hypothetical protein